jgi:hypothetical protein
MQVGAIGSVYYTADPSSILLLLLLSSRDGIFKLLRSIGMDSKESFPPDYICSLASRYDYPIPTRFLDPIDLF